MKDFKKLQADCMQEVKDAGIVPGTVSSWVINTRAKKRWGHCHKEEDGTFEIQIAQRLLLESEQWFSIWQDIVMEISEQIRKVLPQMPGRSGDELLMGITEILYLHLMD